MFVLGACTRGTWNNHVYSWTWYNHARCVVQCSSSLNPCAPSSQFMRLFMFGAVFIFFWTPFHRYHSLCDWAINVRPWCLHPWDLKQSCLPLVLAPVGLDTIMFAVWCRVHLLMNPCAPLSLFMWLGMFGAVFIFHEPLCTFITVLWLGNNVCPWCLHLLDLNRSSHGLWVCCVLRCMHSIRIPLALFWVWQFSSRCKFLEASARFRGGLFKFACVIKHDFPLMRSLALDTYTFNFLTLSDGLTEFPRVGPLWASRWRCSGLDSFSSAANFLKFPLACQRLLVEICLVH